LIYLATGVLIVVAALIALAQFNLWALRPVVYDNLAVQDLAGYIRSWGPWLADRARIVVRHARTDAETELRKHRFATQPDKIVFRARNIDATRKYFLTIQRALDNEHVSYQLEVTPKRRQPRAIAVALVAEDIHTPAAAVKLIERAFGALGALEPVFSVHVEGQIRSAPDTPGVPLIPWRQDHAGGYRLGETIGRAVKRILG
jgi:hypothetical protein